MIRKPLLLTPGPLTTDIAVRRAMLDDWGSRDPAFIALTAELRQRLVDVANGSASHVAVPIQGSGTYVLEAAVDTLIGPEDRLLVAINGAYGERMAAIAGRLGHTVETMVWDENQAVAPAMLANRLEANPAITHVAVVHCETTTGLLNPLEDIARVVSEAGRHLIVDAMSSFGALPIDLRALRATAILASSNKCLEGTPGLAFALIDRAVLEACAGRSRSTTLDLHAQWRGFEKDGQWRFTPPVQVVAALVEALRLLEAEGGPTARLERYSANLSVLLDGAASLGLELFLDPSLQAPIIVTFRSPPGLDFEGFYAALAEEGFLIYPGKLTREASFRIGCIGAVTSDDFIRLMSVLGPALAGHVAAA
ncbi:MAG TPA: 2-aminoethylphosphonate--pyruvate transaminase [Sphingobium sp.]|uniref:2-aminoethylphosphonate--pyruvate transaminase n=1 Tax=Sphingobium sp. TaxID=1912891 RepID=UPI002ED17F2C